MKRHYSPEHWADYARGTVPKREREEMGRHLEAGCKECAQAVGMWTTVLNLAHKESGYQPPDSSVRLAKSYFAMCRFKGKESFIPRVARLVFDSYRQPQLAGVRSMWPFPRHYVYRMGPMLLDIWMKPVNESAPATLTGQILGLSGPSQTFKDMPVKLKNGGRTFQSQRRTSSASLIWNSAGGSARTCI